MKHHSPRFLALVSDVKTRVKEVSVEQVLHKIKRGETFQFFDVREESEWNAGHARGAKPLGKGVIERDIEKAVSDLKSEIILYCGGGFRSALAADNLQKMGYQNVYSMAGGWTAWQEAGAPIEKN